MHATQLLAASSTFETSNGLKSFLHPVTLTLTLLPPASTFKDFGDNTGQSRTIYLKVRSLANLIPSSTVISLCHVI